MTHYLPCRPPSFYFLRFFTALPGWDFPTEVFGWLLVLALFNVALFLLVTWTPAYTYIPKRRKQPPDESRVYKWICKLVNHIENYIQDLPTKRRTRRQLRSYSSSNGRHLFSLRLRRKGYRIRRAGQSKAKPKTDQNRQAIARLVAMAATIQEPPHMVFDSDSYVFALDNCSSYCLTNNLKDFIDKPRKGVKDLLGIGQGQVCYEGTMVWTFEDDDVEETTANTNHGQTYLNMSKERKAWHCYRYQITRRFTRRLKRENEHQLILFRQSGLCDSDHAVSSFLD